MKIFTHTFDIFDSDLLVCVGVKKAEDIKKWLDKKGTKNSKKILDAKEIKKINKIIAENNNGFVLEIKNHDTKYYIFYLKEFKNTWECFGLLLHELVHYKQFQWNTRQVKEEHEFEAYFIESTFRSLRRRLFKELKL